MIPSDSSSTYRSTAGTVYEKKEHKFQNLSLDQLPDNIDLNAELKFSSSDGFYTDSIKTRGILKGIRRSFSFLTRWLPGGSALVFRDANQRVAVNIALKYGEDAKEFFLKDHGSRIFFGRPITVRRERMIDYAYQVTEDDMKKIEALATTESKSPSIDDKRKLYRKILKINLQLEEIRKPGTHVGWRSYLLSSALKPFYSHKTLEKSSHGTGSHLLLNYAGKLETHDGYKKACQLIDQKKELVSFFIQQASTNIPANNKHTKNSGLGEITNYFETQKPVFLQKKWNWSEKQERANSNLDDNINASLSSFSFSGDSLIFDGRSTIHTLASEDFENE